MSDDQEVQAPVAAKTAPVRKKFVRRVPSSLDGAAAARQSRVATLAWTTFGNGEKATAFLNTHSDDLDGRPIDLAVASPDGLARVELLLAAAASDQAVTAA